MKKNIMLAALAACIAMSLPVQAFAAEAGEGKADTAGSTVSETPLPTSVGITPVYSASVQPEENDVFVLMCKGTAGSELDIELNAFENMDDTLAFEVEPDNYTVTAVEYKGSNEAVVEEGYSVNNTFTVMDGEYADLTLAIGKAEGDLLNALYSSTLSYADGEPVNWDSYRARDAAPDPAPDSGNGTQADPTDGDADAPEGAQEADTGAEGHAQSQSAAEEEAKVIYENQSDGEQGAEEHAGRHLALRVVPLIGIAGIVAAVLFILHKKGRI